MTPDNGIYYQIAYTAAAIIYAGYAITIVLRRRKLHVRRAALNAGSERA